MKFDDTRETFSKIATLYYIGEKSQDEIAQMFNISRFKVSRVLKRCRELNIIEFRINNKPCYYKNLEADIERLLGIKKCMIVSPGATVFDSKTNVGRAAGKYLEASLGYGMKVGFDWGSTLQTMTGEFSPAVKYDDCLFIQISGSVASQSMANNGLMDGHDIVKSLATSGGADWSLFPAPYIVKEKVLRNMLMEERSIKNHVANFSRLDMVFMGVGSRRPDIYLPFYSNFLTPDECSELEKETDGNTGELLSCKLDMDGNVLKSLLTDRVMTIGLETLRHVPDTVALAAGADKARSLVAGARGGYIKTVIITEIVALAIAEYLEGFGYG
ncbi:MAG: hypothetical protein FWG03_01580 [Clostridiales bacterium]|nr:hypothetical protein [Clostridiales bacterium]